MDIKAGKRKIRISLFDIVIVILIIAMAAGFLILRNHGSGEQNSSSELVYKIELNNLDESCQGMVNTGDRIIDKIKKNDMGEVVGVEYYPYREFSYDNVNHMKVYTDVPGKITACITLKSDCTDSGASIKTSGGFEVSVGTSVSVIGPGYSGAGYIIFIDRGDN